MKKSLRPERVPGFIQALEARRLFAGTAPDSLVAYHFSFSFQPGAFVSSDGLADGLIAPVGNYWFIDSPNLNWLGNYTYSKVNDTVGELALPNIAFVGDLKATLTFTTKDYGSIRLSRKHTIQRGSFMVESTTPALFHYTGDEADEDPGDLTIFGTNAADNIQVTRKSGGLLRINRNGTVKEIRADLVNELAIVAGDGADKVSIGPGVKPPDEFTDSDNPNGVFILAGGGNDTVIGGDGWDRISGGSGSDLLQGGGGNDTIDGGKHNDTIFGNDGDDQLSGNDGDDSIDGGNGNDSITGGAGKDRMLGGAGNDILYSNDAIADVLNGGPGDDTSHADSKDSLDLVEHLL